MERYSRQENIWGPQKQFEGKQVTVVGCGALGSVAAELLVRMGISVTVIDRDVVELNNLHRELYTEQDCGKAKATALAERLQKVNSTVEIKGIVEHIHGKTVSLLKGDCIIDGTDNIRTRLLLNEYCMQKGIPWVYGAVLGQKGVGAVFVGKPCFSCIYGEPAPGALETCETSGVDPSMSAQVGAWQAGQAIQVLQGKARTGVLKQFGGEELTIQPKKECVCCVKGEYHYINRKDQVVQLCGKRTYHLTGQGAVDLNTLSKQFEKNPKYQGNSEVAHFRVNGKEVTVFASGRAIVRGTVDEKEALQVYGEVVSH